MSSPKALSFFIVVKYENDPAAGSPTATLLRLLPLLDREYRQILDRPRLLEDKSSKWLYSLPITGNDGRCVQEPGTYSVRSDETRLQDIPCSWRIIAIINPHHDSGSKDSPDRSAQAAMKADARWLNQCSARAAQNI